MPKIHTYVLSILALTGLLNTSLTQAQEPADWNPCPASLAEADAPEPPNGTRWELTLSPYTYHWNDNPEHRRVFLGALDRTVAGNRFCGLALFRNSFGQPAAFAYVGQRWDGIGGQAKLFAKVSAGFIYGYKGKYQDKIPFNHSGVAPAIITAIGYDFAKNESIQAMVLGRAGVLFAYGRSF